ncbi:proteasome ATPase [Scrofimicrobium sp. R131]|uniref:Proteasome ATPase n=1 Tax=Scrofimicrobium appendicitidis TaxID=3079930 RepID=A0AAU7V4B4_9ACTO
MSEMTPDTVSQLRLSVAGLEEKNHRLSKALVVARDQIEGLQEQLERIHRAPATWATFIEAFPEKEELEVYHAGRLMRVTSAPSLRLDDLSPGQLVRISDQMVAVAPGEFPRTGSLGSVLELHGTDRVLVSIDTGQEHVLRLAGTLRHGGVKPGDTLAVDLRSGFAYERLVRSHIEQLFTPEKPDVSYADIGGLDAQIEMVRDAIELPFQYPEKYRAFGLRPPRGILLYGPPGTGKTLIAKAVAASLGGPEAEQETYFISIKGPELLNKYVGETERLIRAIFGRARALASQDVPVVIFFDEIEALFRTRGSGVSSDVETMIVPQLLAEMDGVESLDNVVVIGASNRPDMIDPAVLRPGRLDVRVRIDRPTRRQARDIFSKYLTPDLPLDPELVSRAGSPEAAAKAMIEAALDRLYTQDETTLLFDMHLADGKVRQVYLSDLVSGAMIAGTVERAKKRAIKDSLEGGAQGLTTAHVLAGVDEEVQESADLAATTTPDEWARTVGLRAEEVVRIDTRRNQ